MNRPALASVPSGRPGGTMRTGVRRAAAAGTASVALAASGLAALAVAGPAAPALAAVSPSCAGGTCTVTYASPAPASRSPSPPGSPR